MIGEGIQWTATRIILRIDEKADWKYSCAMTQLGFSFGLSESQKSEHMRVWLGAFERTARSIDINPSVTQHLRSVGAQDFVNGVSRPGKTFFNILSKEIWNWHSADHWGYVFSQNNVWPETWRNYHIDKKKSMWACETMAHYIMHMSHQSLRVKSGKELEQDKLEGRGWIAHSFSSCPIENLFADKWNKEEIDGLPPFFPGDRTMVKYTKTSIHKDIKTFRKVLIGHPV